MPRFMLAYHGGKMPETQEEGAAMMDRWRAWFESLGDAVADPGNPVGQSKTVSAAGVSDDGGANPLSGYSILEAETIEAAIAMTDGCPHLEGGSVEVAEIIVM